MPCTWDFRSTILAQALCKYMIIEYMEPQVKVRKGLKQPNWIFGGKRHFRDIRGTT